MTKEEIEPFVRDLLDDAVKRPLDEQMKAIRSMASLLGRLAEDAAFNHGGTVTTWEIRELAENMAAAIAQIDAGGKR